jgi:hypothetical protein
MTAYLAALGVTIGIEAPVVALAFPGQRLRMACACVAATTATHVFMHFGLPRVLHSPGHVLVLGELIATVVEAAVYAVVGRPPSLGRGLVASAIANTLSYSAGLLF